MKPIRKFGFGPIRAISELYPTKLGIRPDFTRTKNPPTHSEGSYISVRDDTLNPTPDSRKNRDPKIRKVAKEHTRCKKENQMQKSRNARLRLCTNPRTESKREMELVECEVL